MNIRIIAALFLVATLLLVTACGSESDSPAPAGGTTERPGTTTNAPTVPADTEAVANPAPQVENAEPEQFFKTRNFNDDFTGVSGVTITEYTGSSKELIFPATIGGKQVVIIGGGGQGVFEDDRVRENVESIIIPHGVLMIGNTSEGSTVYRGAFSNSINLKNVTLPEGLEFIGDNTFSGCAGLESIIIPDSVTRIGNNSFAKCTGLTSIDIPDGVTSIGYLAFSGSGLTSIVIPDSVTRIGTGAFTGCVNLTDVSFRGISYSYENIQELYDAINNQ
jgi:hypothetical protein